MGLRLPKELYKILQYILSDRHVKSVKDHKFLLSFKEGSFMCDA